MDPWTWTEILTAGFLLGVWVSGQAEDESGRDVGRIVIDEVVGMLASVAFLAMTSLTAGLGFLIFRLMDVVKPFPAGLSQRLPGGWGVMADDIVAGADAGLATWVILHTMGGP